MQVCDEARPIQNAEACSHSDSFKLVLAKFFIHHRQDFRLKHDAFLEQASKVVCHLLPKQSMRLTDHKYMVFRGTCRLPVETLHYLQAVGGCRCLR